MTGKLVFSRSGAGLPLVFVHGFLGGSKMWRYELEAFSRHYDVIAPNLSGFSKSAHLPGLDRIESHAEQVLDLLDRLDVGTFYVVGHSMGGMVAQQMAIVAGDRIAKLVLYGTSPGGDLPGRFETPEASRKRLFADGVVATSRHIAATWFVKGAAAEQYSSCAAIGASASLEGAIAGTRAFENWDSRSRLAQLNMPTLVIWGEKDRSIGWEHVETLWRNIKNASLAVCPNCAHNVHMERPDLYQLLLRDFLAET